MHNRGQRTTTYVHDDAGRVVETRHPDNSTETVRYDKAGREISRTDARSNTTAFVYDDAGRLLSTTNTLNQTTSTTYRPDGSKASVRDALNRLETVTQGTQVTRYTYTAVGSRERITLPTGARTDYTYDARNRLQTLAHANASGGTLLHQTYTVYASGLRTQLVEYGQNIGTTRTVAYTYDVLKRLRREEVTDSTRGNRVSA